MIRIAIAVLVVIGLVLTVGRRKRREEAAPPEPTEGLRPYDTPGQAGSENRSPLDPTDPEISGGAAKRLGEEERHDGSPA
ncbi:MAG: hypothetical protein JWM87_157 [Candidatus Eremiobacteraeota bacterium]|nr:hypothetical protein [Candidatus Eremiobacteraeota bacterium]